MSVRNQLKLLVGGLGARRTGRATPVPSPTREFFEQSRLVTALIFLATVAAILLISSAGVTTLDMPVLTGQVATVRVVAGAPFSYESAERTRSAREQIVARVPPVYRLETAPFKKFENDIASLLGALEQFERDHPANAPALTDRRAALGALVDAFNARGPYRASPNDVAVLLASGDAKRRATLIGNGLGALRELYAEGVHDAGLSGGGPDSVTIFQIAKPTGEITQRPVQSMEEALTLLRVTLASDGARESLDRETALALFRLCRNGLAPNLVFDRAATHAREEIAASTVRPVIVNVPRGQSVIEPGDRVTADQYEMLTAHRDWLRSHRDTAVDEDLALFGRILLVFAMVIACVVYIRLEDRETSQSNARLGLLALVVIGNLALVRAVFSLGGAEFFVRDGSWASTLPYTAPTALAPLIVAILIDAGSGIFTALLISIFTAVIYGNRLDLLVLTFLASMVAIFGVRHLRSRGLVVRAAAQGGLVVAVFALLIGLADQVPMATVTRQMAAGIATGVFTGIAVVGLLPVLESLFKRTTDITLLELTDFNHPLLRLMQLETPGTYHHSLVVAQLAENACNAIGANPLLARVCALFHDVGKTAKPDYFTENQRDGNNPHDTANPSLSALIIKAHVKDGVDLAIRHRLPRAVIDVIQQHHGTTLIRSFYYRAVSQTRPPIPGAQPENVPQSTYRYDGPRPQFKESAVISLADGVEAASRSLRSVSPQHLGELIDQVFRDRIDDGQLDEAPLTFEEIAKVKNSFTFTLLNMLHSRVAYPEGESEPEIRNRKTDVS